VTGVARDVLPGKNPELGRPTANVDELCAAQAASTWIVASALLSAVDIWSRNRLLAKLFCRESDPEVQEKLKSKTPEIELSASENPSGNRDLWDQDLRDLTPRSNEGF